MSIPPERMSQHHFDLCADLMETTCCWPNELCITLLAFSTPFLSSELQNSNRKLGWDRNISRKPSRAQLFSISSLVAQVAVLHEIFNYSFLVADDLRLKGFKIGLMLRSLHTAVLITTRW